MNRGESVGRTLSSFIRSEVIIEKSSLYFQKPSVNLLKFLVEIWAKIFEMLYLPQWMNRR